MSAITGSSGFVDGSPTDLVFKGQTETFSNGVMYNQMMDESKHTEEHDVSRSDFTDTHSQDTRRDLSKMQDEQETNMNRILGENPMKILMQDDDQKKMKKSGSKNKKILPEAGSNYT